MEEEFTDSTGMMMAKTPITPAGGPAAKSEKEPVATGLQAVGEADIQQMKSAAMRVRMLQGEGEAPEVEQLLTAVENLLVKGGWIEGPSGEQARPDIPVPAPAVEIPDGEVIEGRSLSKGQDGRDLAVNKPKAPTDGEVDEPEEGAGAKPRYSGDGIVLPIELIGVLHDSILELAGQEESNEDSPARNALGDLIDQMEAILDGISGSDKLARLAESGSESDQ